MSDFKEYVQTLEDALNLALKALEAISGEMTVGERYTNAGQHLLDALQPCRNALQAAPAQEHAIRCHGLTAQQVEGVLLDAGLPADMREEIMVDLGLPTSTCWGKPPSHVDNAPPGFSPNEASAWSTGYEHGYENACEDFYRKENSDAS